MTIEQYEMQNGYVLVKNETERMTSSGIFVVVGEEKSNNKFMRVVNSKSEHVKVGDKVLVAKADLIATRLENQDYFLLKEEEVLAIAEDD